MHRRTALGLLASAFAARPAFATPHRYDLDVKQSTVAFTYSLNGQRMTGRMPVAAADILLDIDAPARSQVSASIDAAHANAGLIFATNAMKDPSVLDVRAYPRITFVSENVTPNGKGARVTGPLTIRNVTREVTLDAVVYRQRGTEAGDRRNLSILMTGSVDRRDYGASGYPQFVGAEIGLNILTRITLADDH